MHTFAISRQRRFATASALILLAFVGCGVTNERGSSPGPEDPDAPTEFTATESGLKYRILRRSDGRKPTASNSVTVDYVGWLDNGREFDNSYIRREPTSFGLSQVVRGWTEGLQLMNVGSKFRFVIPSDLAYGDRGAGQAIGPGETLIFEVELLEIKS